MARNGGLSRYCRAMLLHTMFGHSSNIYLTAPTEAFMALSRSSISQSDSGLMLDEPPAVITVDGVPASTSYSRAPVPMGEASGGWIESGISAVVNDIDIRFPLATAPWGTIKYWALMDRDASGNILAYGALRTKATVREGDYVVISPGALQISLDSYDMEW